MLRIDKVTKEFPQSSGGRKRVLEDISLKIEDNEFVCILGKSGCGKSTLLIFLPDTLYRITEPCITIEI